MIQNLFLSFTAILPGYRVYIGVSSKKKRLQKIKKYPLGQIITNYSCESILDTLNVCYKRGLEYYSSLNRERKERGAIDVK